MTRIAHTDFFRMARMGALAALLFALAGASHALPPNLPKNTPLRIIFVTSTLVDGNIGGLAGADARVAAAAASPGSLVAGSPKPIAILSVTGTLAQSRFVDNGEPIYNTHGDRVADSLSQMFGGGGTSLINAVLYDEKGASIDAIVWTGSQADGTLAPTHCTDYTTNTTLQDGRIGTSAATDLQWVEYGTLNCVNPARLYGLTVVVSQDTPVPALGAWALGVLALLLGAMAMARQRRDRSGQPSRL